MHLSNEAVVGGTGVGIAATAAAGAGVAAVAAATAGVGVIGAGIALLVQACRAVGGEAAEALENVAADLLKVERVVVAAKIPSEADLAAMRSAMAQGEALQVTLRAKLRQATETLLIAKAAATEELAVAATLGSSSTGSMGSAQWQAISKARRAVQEVLDVRDADVTMLTARTTDLAHVRAEAERSIAREAPRRPAKPAKRPMLGVARRLAAVNQSIREIRDDGLREARLAEWRNLAEQSVAVDGVVEEHRLAALEIPVANTLEAQRILDQWMTFRAVIEVFLPSVPDSQRQPIVKWLQVVPKSADALREERRAIEGTVAPYRWASAVISALRDIGYETKSGMATALIRDGKIVVIDPRDGDYVVECKLDRGAGAVATEVKRRRRPLRGTEEQRRHDMAAEQRWCVQQTAFVEALEEHVGEPARVISRVALGARAMEVTADASHDDRSATISHVPKSRGAE